MMRGIKLKAWDKELERMCDVIYLDFSANEIIIYHKSEEERSNWLKLKRFILLQSINSKDKNFKEIYEGFIVKIDYHSNLLEIKWHDKKMKWVATDGTFTINLNKNECRNYVKVVGNKYENPELIQNG